jgi:hypothetical protein
MSDSHFDVAGFGRYRQELPDRLETDVSLDFSSKFVELDSDRDDEEPVDEESVDEESVDEESVDEESVDQEPAPSPLPINYFPVFEPAIRATPVVATPVAAEPVAATLVEVLVEPVDFESVVRAFVESSEMAHEFGSTLTVEDRKKVHDLASHFGLRHVSRDKDGLRLLTISKPGLASNASSRSTSSSDLILATSQSIISHASVDAVLADTQANSKALAAKNIVCDWPDCGRVCKNLRGWQKHRESHK